MFEKIKWKNHKFYYTFDINEPVFNTDYFQFYNGNAKGDIDGNVHYEPLKLDYNIIMVSSNELMVEGPFYSGYYVVINNIPYPYFEEETKPEEPEAKPDDKPELKEPSGIYKLIEDDNAFYFDKLPEDYALNYQSVDVVIDEYTNEVYPDYPFRSKKHTFKLNKFHKVEVFKKERNIIYHIYVNTESEKYFLKYISNILCYFSNVESLKSFIKDLELNIPLKPDNELKMLIQEKSVLLKRRFGLREEYTENQEYMPIFKRVVNLYCIEDLIAISFINGNFISTGEHGTNNGMKLSKFSIDGDGGTGGYALSTDLIKNLIDDAETDLYKSLFKQPVNKKKKGLYNRCLSYQR